jgi:hypothetical protein
MKKIFFVALSATLLAVGCQKTEVLNPVGGSIMSFTTGMGKLTKAQGTVDAENEGIRNLEAQDFSVWAYADPQSDFSTVTTVNGTTKIYDGIENLLVECTTASVDAVAGVDDDPDTAVNEKVEAVEAKPGTWSTDTEYYWPGENKDLRFFAVSADGDWLRPTAQGAVCPVTINYAAPSITVNDFTVRAVATADKTAANEDLMIADFVKQNQSDKVVDLKFRHTLSKVEFIFKTLAPSTTGETAPTVYVQSLKVDGLQNKGDLNVTAVDATATPIVWNYTWTNDETSTANFTDDWKTTVTFAETVEDAAKSDNTAMQLTTTPETFATWLMLPQTITGKKVVITYVINNRQFTSIFPIDNTEKNLTAWAYNQHIKYTITLAPNLISFNPSVEEWKTPTAAENVEYQN